MPPTAQHLDIARNIDRRVNSILKWGNDEDLLRKMHKLMPDFKIILDTADASQKDQLCQEFEGFHHFAKLLEQLAGAISSGKLKGLY